MVALVAAVVASVVVPASGNITCESDPGKSNNNPKQTVV